MNSGGLIQVADELEGFSFERAQQRASGIFETTRRVFDARRVATGTAGGRRRPARRASGCATWVASAASGCRPLSAGPEIELARSRASDMRR